ncbi:MAG: ADP-ribosylglycohydrolase family protein, partial [Muribaculaceae bacterium]|nr:ADP-ribosylglycohydrolase family protein [Muribaculaceae bacterium]
SMIECNGIDHMDFARRFKEWFDRQDIDDMDAHMRLVLQEDSFLEDPHATCRRIYERQGFYEAPNEALGRAVLCGLWPGDIEKNVTDNCRLTHWDNRCVASCVITATVANELLWHRRMVDYDHLLGLATRLDPSVIPYIEAAHDGSLDDFAIDDEETSWYVRKNLGIALWCLWHHTVPEEALLEVVAQGGDANANGAIAMGLMGLRYGYSNLPARLLEGLLEGEILESVSDRLIDTLQHADDGHDTDD